MTSKPAAVAGYSGKPLVEKLGIRPGYRISIANAPGQFLRLLGRLPEGVVLLAGRASGLDVLHLFVVDGGQLTEAFPRAKQRIKPDGMLWVSWPKQTSGLKSDLNENTVREIGLAHGLVDVKVAAIDLDWSALKFVYRTKDRPGKGR
jgi:hypothetical protein